MGTQKKWKLEHEAHTDVAYIDICEPALGAKIDVVEIGSEIGFPFGQVMLRVDREQRLLLGLTIHQFSSFKRRLMWHYRIASIQRGLQLLVASLLAGMGSNGKPIHACS